MMALHDPRLGSLLLPAWPAPARVRALTTTRRGFAPGDAGSFAAGPMGTAMGTATGTRTGTGTGTATGTAAGASAGAFADFNLGSHVGDDAGAVAANRARLRGVLPAEPVWLNQVHGTLVIDVPAASQSGEAVMHAVPPEADAAVTRAPGTVLAILTADCLPVLLCDRSGSVVAVAHAGWRGLAAGVIENAVCAMAVPASGIMAWLGPAIGPAAYEVGADVADAFTGNDPGAAAAFAPRAHGMFLADLYALARRRLAQLGVAQVSGGEACTYGDAARFYSHRRDGRTGRMASLIWIDVKP